MNCDEVRELLGAYALDAVPPDEREAIEAHLEGCGLHEEVVSLRAAAFGLGAAAPARTPPPELESRIMQAALATRPASRPSAPAAARRGPRLARLRSAPALAAALAIVAVGLGAWVAVLLAGGDDGQELARSSAGVEEQEVLRQYTYSYRGRGGETSLQIETVVGEGPASVEVGGLARLPAEEAYHLWLIRDERWLRIGFFNTSPEGRWRGEFDFPFEAGDDIALTIGSASGDARPAGEPLFRTPL